MLQGTLLSQIIGGVVAVIFAAAFCMILRKFKNCYGIPRYKILYQLGIVLTVLTALASSVFCIYNVIVAALNGDVYYNMLHVIMKIATLIYVILTVVHVLTDNLSKKGPKTLGIYAFIFGMCALFIYQYNNV